MNGTTPHNPDELARQLNTHTAAGDMGKAYALLRQKPSRNAWEILLRAGFPVINHTDKDFWTFAQNAISRACLNRTTGHGAR